MITTTIDNRSRLATCEGIRQTFARYRSELEWLAYFITGEQQLAEACLADACALARSDNQGFEEWLLTWARHATVRAAYNMLRARIRPLASIFARWTCIHDIHGPLSCSEVALIVEETPFLLSRLDLLCRCVLIICGVEKYTVIEAASFFGLSSEVVEAAYCRALDLVDVIRCERFRENDSYAAVCN